MKPIPKLILSHKPLKTVLQSLAAPDVLFVADAHNESLVTSIGDTYRAETNALSVLKRYAKHMQKKTVVGVGGCTALDVGRYLAQNNTFISVPTILSNSCISVNRSVVCSGAQSYSIPTVTPAQTIISIPDMMDTPKATLHMWCSSGCGDLFSNIAACIEEHYLHTTKPATPAMLFRMTPLTFGAMTWILAEKENVFSFSEGRVRRLAIFLHLSSCDVIRRGNTTRSAGSEHSLYYQMLHDHHYAKNGPTHGQLVTIGTLCTAYIHAQLSGDTTIFTMLTCAYRKLKLPTTWSELQSIGVTRTAILASLHALASSKPFYGKHLIPHAESILDSIYG